MKKKTLLIVFLFSAIIASTFAQITVTGKLIDNKAEPIEYANVLLQFGDKFEGTMSDEQGYFKLQSNVGTNKLRISIIGYDTYEREIVFQENTDLGEIILNESAIKLNEVVVKSDRIIRSADRFTLNLANDPTIVGKAAVDVLNQSPGVFIQERDGAISINGKSGTQIYVNDRPLHETGKDLLRYLQTLKAEDIVRIEVLPIAGAGYDANMQGGIIKITLKRQREDGLYGSAGVSYRFSPDENTHSLNPSFDINYKNKRLSLYLKLNYDKDRYVENATEDVDTRGTDRTVHSSIHLPISSQTGRVRLGGVYELDDRQSLGIEGNYSHSIRRNKSIADVKETTGSYRTDIHSAYRGKNVGDVYSVSANYILRMDTLGSTFKVLFDYLHNKSDDNQNYNSIFSGYLNYDTIYASNMLTNNDLYALSTDLSFKLNEYTSLDAGLKYVRNDMDNDVLFEYQKDMAWHINEPYSYINQFSENIGAVYGSFSSRIKNVHYSLGLRGEYTHASPKTNKSDKTKNQSYFELFPSVNVMLPLAENNKHTLVLNYSRKIQRPSFSQLNPFRMPGSEYLYIEGNPDLKPALFNDYSASFRLFSRYNLTAGFTDAKGTFERVLTTDPDISGVIIQRTENVGSRKNYYVAFNTALPLSKWWQMNINLLFGRNEVKVFGKKRASNTFQGFMSNTFILPKQIMLDLNGFYSSPTIEGNAEIKIDPQVNFALRKEFFDRKLSMKAFVNNIFNTGVIRLKTDEDDFYRNMRVRFNHREIGLSLTYNFNVGKSVKVKNVEMGAEEEKERLR